MSIDRGMDKDVVYIYIYIYAMEYSSVKKKERNNVICNSVDEPRDYHTKRSKSEKDNII